MTRYDVRQAAKALFDLGAANGGDPGTFDRDSAEIRAYLDRVFDKAWQSSPIRAALASGERGVPVAWIIPGDIDTGTDGWIPAKSWRDGEFTRPLYADPGDRGEAASALIEFFARAVDRQEQADRSGGFSLDCWWRGYRERARTFVQRTSPKWLDASEDEIIAEYKRIFDIKGNAAPAENDAGRGE